MEIKNIIDQVNEIFIDELDNDDIQIDFETTANDIDEWDSLTHISLVVGIEKHFKIKFSAMEIQNFKNVGEMCENILSKLS